MAANTGIFDYSQGNYIKRVDWDASGNPIYQGWALTGTATSAATWRIVKNNYDASSQFTDSSFPNGSPAFSFVWDNRASLTYL